MDKTKIKQWADVMFSDDCDFQLAVTLGWSGQDLTKEQLIEFLTYLCEHEPSAAGINHLFSTGVFADE